MDKLLAWERSAKLHHARAVARHRDKLLSETSTEATPIVDFANRYGARIEAERANYWPPPTGKKAKHPNRWTGRGLDDDAEEADRLAHRGFVDFYQMRYRQICWNVHGSGLAGVTGLDSLNFPGIVAFAFGEIARFAIVAAEMTVRLVDAWDVEMERRFSDLSKAKKIRTALALNAHPFRQRPTSGR